MSVKRTILKSFKSYLTKYPILVLTGPRQSGKTTFLRDNLKNYRYVNLESPDIFEYATNDPKGFLAEYDDKVIIDEAQKVPALFSFLQGIVDTNQVMGQYILSGSQNFNLMENITQSLAGRVGLFRLFPYDFAELKSGKFWDKDLSKMMTTGFYPAIYNRDINPDKYYRDYLNTYVKRDITQLVNIQNHNAFNRFVRLCATRAGQLLNYSSLARDAGVSHSTAANWLSLLETSYVVYQIPPYYNNYSKRLTKSPKLYFYDTGLLCHLLNIRKGSLSPSHSFYGHIFENFIVSEKLKRIAHNDLNLDLYFWRDNHGNEVDLLHHDADKLHIYEIKSSKTISHNMFSGLSFFQQLAKEEVSKKVLIYGGLSNQNRSEYDVLSWSKLS